MEINPTKSGVPETKYTFDWLTDHDLDPVFAAAEGDPNRPTNTSAGWWAVERFLQEAQQELANNPEVEFEIALEFGPILAQLPVRYEFNKEDVLCSLPPILDRYQDVITSEFAFNTYYYGVVVDRIWDQARIIRRTQGSNYRRGDLNRIEWAVVSYMDVFLPYIKIAFSTPGLI